MWETSEAFEFKRAPNSSLNTFQVQFKKNLIKTGE